MMMMPVLVWCRSWQASALASLSICNKSFYSDSMYWILKTFVKFSPGRLEVLYQLGGLVSNCILSDNCHEIPTLSIWSRVDQEGHWCVYRGQEKPGQWGWRASCRACACSMPCTSATSLPPALGELEPRMVTDVKINGRSSLLDFTLIYTNQEEGRRLLPLTLSSKLKSQIFIHPAWRHCRVLSVSHPAHLGEQTFLNLVQHK